jgi:ATP-dependent DNA helicase RecG
VRNGDISGRSLDEPLQYLKGIGPQVAQALGKLNLFTVGDLLRHFPRRWEDRTNFRRVAEVQTGEWVTVHGVVIAVTTKYPKPRLTITEALLDDAGSALKLVWFN